MSTSKLQATQTVLHDVLSELGNSADAQLDTLLGFINTSLKEPGLLSLGAGLVVNVGSTTLALPNGTNIRLALGDVDVGGLSGSVNFSTGTGSGDVQSVALPTMTANQYYKAGFEIRSDKKIYVVFGAIGASEALAGFPDWNTVSLALGYITLQVNSGGTAFNTPTAASLNQLNRSGGGGQLSDHTLLSSASRSTANQHPTTAIATTTGQFVGSLSATQDEAQKAFVRLEQFNSVFDWVTSKAYRVGNIVKQSGTVYRCLVAHTSGTFATDLSGGKWELAISSQDHNTLANRNAASAHPASSIDTTVTNFTDFFRSTDTTDQICLDRLDDYTSIRAYVSGNTYRVNNVVIQSGTLWRCTTDGASGTFNESDWTLVLNAPNEEVQTVTAGGGQSVFTLSSVTIPTANTKLWIFVNGVYQIKTTHYTVDSPTQVTFTSTLPQNAEVVFRLG